MKKVLNVTKSTSVMTTVAALLFSVLSSVPATSAGVITEYAGVGDYPRGITVGPDGNLWVAGQYHGEIVKVTTSGVSTKFGGFSREVLNNNPSPEDVTVGADGNIWFTKGYGLLNIGRISTSGTVTEFPSGMAHNTGIVALGNHVWYASSYYSKLGKMAMDGTKTTVDIPGAAYQLTVGPDKNIWAALTSRNSIVRVDVKTNETTEYTIPTAGSQPYAITSGPDGNIWFTMLQHRIGKLEISTGTITEYELPTAGSGLAETMDSSRLATGPVPHAGAPDPVRFRKRRRPAQYPPDGICGGTGRASVRRHGRMVPAQWFGFHHRRRADAAGR